MRRDRKMPVKKGQGASGFLSHLTDGYCWRTQKCRNLFVPHAFFEGKKAWETCARKSTARPSRSKWQKIYCKTIRGRLIPVKTTTWSSESSLASTWFSTRRDDTVDRLAKNLCNGVI